MQIENSSTRLKQIMQERNLRQVDLLELVKPFCEKYKVKMNKSDISQYLSGVVKPGQEKLSMLGMALNINESWLMGFDAPKEKPNYTDQTELTKNEKQLLDCFNKLNDLGQVEALKRVDELTYVNKYLKADNIIELPKNKKEIWEEKDKGHLMPQASHDNDGTFSEEDYKHDDDIMKNDDLWK
ncbi:transcriptional regulator [Clostridium intestinale]|uniref:transcriptional regulator n=1 Tax=Clostridium intestinale TaxID=36845 RepID=UPI002DD6B0A1|nr:transcriptional regulator [Clostridium intestinale]WRY49506.1 transcriptional regulator [Clostridium intestinale]